MARSLSTLLACAWALLPANALGHWNFAHWAWNPNTWAWKNSQNKGVYNTPTPPPKGIGEEDTYTPQENSCEASNTQIFFSLGQMGTSIFSSLAYSDMIFQGKKEICQSIDFPTPYPVSWGLPKVMVGLSGLEFDPSAEQHNVRVYTQAITYTGFTLCFEKSLLTMLRHVDVNWMAWPGGPSNTPALNP